MADEQPGEPESSRRDRPKTDESYGIPPADTGMLPWSFVEETLAGERNYWVTTMRPDGQPHVRPTWGVWVDGQFHCGGGERTRWVRNLTKNPIIVVHTQSAVSVVIVEGTAERIDEEMVVTGEDGGDPTDLIERLDEAYEAKYDIRHGPPFFAVKPDRVLAWSDYPVDATRWRFDE